MKMKIETHLPAWIKLCLWTAVSGLLFLGCPYISASEIEVQRITKEELKSMLGKPDLLILDVRANRDWKDSEWKMKLPGLKARVSPGLAGFAGLLRFAPGTIHPQA